MSLENATDKASAKQNQNIQKYLQSSGRPRNRKNSWPLDRKGLLKSWHQAFVFGFLYKNLSSLSALVFCRPKLGISYLTNHRQSENGYSQNLFRQNRGPRHHGLF